MLLDPAAAYKSDRDLDQRISLASILRSACRKTFNPKINSKYSLKFRATLELKLDDSLCAMT